MGGSGGGTPTFGRPDRTGGESPTNRPDDVDGSGGSGIENDECANLELLTHLQSPKRDVVIKLKVHDMLSLESTSGGPPVIAKTSGGETAGGVVANVKKILDCMAKGHTFVAEVVSISGGSVQLRVYRQ